MPKFSERFVRKTACAFSIAGRTQIAPSIIDSVDLIEISGTWDMQRGRWVGDTPVASSELGKVLPLGPAKVSQPAMDADEPLTADWLKAIGFDCKDAKLGRFRKPSSAVGPICCLYLQLTPDCIACWLKQEKWNDRLTISLVDILAPTTRGELRALCAALGVTLDEPGQKGLAVDAIQAS